MQKTSQNRHRKSIIRWHIGRSCWNYHRCDYFRDLPEQNKAMTKFNELRSWGCDPAVSENRGDNKKFKNWFSLSIRQNEGIFIRSCFKTKDDAGRLMPYMYYSSSPLIEEAIEDLNKYSSMVQKELDIEEIAMGYDEILKYPKKNDEQRSSDNHRFNRILSSLPFRRK